MARIGELARCAVDCLSADLKAFFTRRSKKDDTLLQIGTDPQPIGTRDGGPERQACGCQSPGDDDKDRAATRARQ